MSAVDMTNICTEHNMMVVINELFNMMIEQHGYPTNESCASDLINFIESVKDIRNEFGSDHLVDQE